MIKRLSLLVLAGLLAMPTAALAGDLEDRIEALEEKQETWDMSSRIQWSGDYRFRLDSMSADVPSYYQMTSLGPVLMPAYTVENDTVYTNRLRLNMRTKVMENVEVKARLAMYKVWGMQSNSEATFGGPFTLGSMAFDGSAARGPQDSALRVDRVFMNWNNIGDMPIWFSIGRRPVTDGPPAHIRMGTGKKMATPISYMDYPFDGFSLGYAYENLFGLEDLPGRVRFCYGRGYEEGPVVDGANTGLDDVDFSGISWDIFKKDDRFMGFQSFAAFNMFNYPGDVDLLATMGLPRANLGDIYHTSAVYMSKFQSLNYFVTTGWSRTEPRGTDAMGNSLLISGDGFGNPTEPLDSKDGYNVFVGVRYDLDDVGLKFGLEYNYGSEDWISFTPGHDDLYMSKLATRGSVVEVYGIWDLPAGEAISKISNAFIRLGYQHYAYDYTGSGYWLGTPAKVDDLATSPMYAQMWAPLESMDQIYLTMEAWF